VQAVQGGDPVTGADETACDRCGQTPAIVQTFCKECGPIPLCGDCTTQHVMELEDEPEVDLSSAFTDELGGTL
jgi:hypothetical protein